MVVAIDARAGPVGVQLADDRLVTLPRAYLQRKTAIGDPTLLHAYAGTAHIAQGITTGRAFVLGSDISYREWGYVAWSRARLETRFYICEPDIEEIAAEHHTAAEPHRDARSKTSSARLRAAERNTRHLSSSMARPGPASRGGRLSLPTPRPIDPAPLVRFGPGDAIRSPPSR